MIIKFILTTILACIFLSLNGCSVHYDNVSFDKVADRTVVPAIEAGDQDKIRDLRNAILALDSNIDPNEAAWVAREAVLYPLYLANTYDLVWPPNFQNVLVNTGRRSRGLCYQWAKDMNDHIGIKKYKTLTLSRAVANQGGNFEHNVLTVAAKGKGIDDSIILDAWRHNSILYWVKAKDDPHYQWKKYYPRSYILNDNGTRSFISNRKMATTKLN